jgi:hypothetical protein
MKRSSGTRELGRRLPRLRRAEQAERPGMRLTTRDAAIIMAVYRYRVLTTLQIQALFFQQNKKESNSTSPTKINTRCQHRLQLLFHNGYLMRDEQPQKLADGRKPLIYTLDERGAALVEEFLDGEELDWSRRGRSQVMSALFLEHLLASNDVRVALTLACRKHNYKIVSWLDERILRRQHMTDTVNIKSTTGRTQRVAVVPDGYFLIDTGSHLYSCFLEIDRATSTGRASAWGRRDWARKVTAYLEYYRSGLYHSRYRVQGLRVLTVTINEKRLSNLKAITESVGGRSRFWFSTLGRISAGEILADPIWQKAGDAGFHTLFW